LDGYKDKIGDMLARGHTYTWELEPSGGGTSVTQIYNWNQVTDDGFRPVRQSAGSGRIARHPRRLALAC